MLINNRNLHIESHGPEDGHPLVFLHHGLGSTRAWRGQVPAFVDAGYRVIVYDRWGYGKSDPRPHLNVPSFVDDLADLEEAFQHLNVERSTLIGHSDGGTIALYYAVQNPDRVAALVTVAAHIYLEPKMEPGILGIKHAFENDLRFRRGMQRVHGEKFESVFNNWFHGWHQPEALSWDMQPLLRDIRCPVLVIQGEEDEHAEPQHAIDIAENIPNAELWLVPDAKHMLPQEIPGEFNRKVLEFLNGT
jgi:pimeloyl-ACP methyl ester carboxylesterase